MRRSAPKHRPGGTLPLPVLRALRKLGHDIRGERRRRRITVAIAAQRASICKTTWLKVDKSDPGVLGGTCVMALFVPGLVDRVAQLADPGTDTFGLRLEQEQSPQRVRNKCTRPESGSQRKGPFLPMPTW